MFMELLHSQNVIIARKIFVLPDAQKAWKSIANKRQSIGASSMQSTSYGGIALQQEGLVLFPN